MATTLQTTTLTASLVKSDTLEANIRYNGLTATPAMMTALVTPPVPPGQITYASSGTYAFVAPASVTSVSVVAVGAGGSGIDGSSGYSGGGGGGLGWKNAIPVTPGSSYTVVVPPQTPKGTMAQNAYFIDLNTVAGYGGGRGYPASAGSYNTNGPNQNGSSYGAGGGWQGDGGGAGGQANSSSHGGGGAGGYSGNGGRYAQLPAADSGGASGGGSYSSTYGWGAGGGVGLNGKGTTATGWYHGSSGQVFSTSPGNGGGGEGGSGGARGMSGENPTNSSGEGGNSGLYGGIYGGGGGGCGDGWPGNGGIGAKGGVRIIWGAGRSYPSQAA